MPILVVALGTLLVVGILASLVMRWQAKPAIRHVLAVLAILLVSAVVSVFLTILLMPLWRWLEENVGIESVGHSGPAGWCFGAMFVVSVVALGSLYAFRNKV